MTTLDISKVPQLPQELRDHLIKIMKDRLPAPVDDAILNDIVTASVEAFKGWVIEK